MTERDAYIQKLEAEQQEALARFQEIEAQADLAQSEDDLDTLTGARALREDVARELQALRQADQRDWERLKSTAGQAHARFTASLDRAGRQWSQLRAAYRHQREAELLNLGSQLDRWEAARARTAAEDSLLTRQEFAFLKRGLQNSRALLSHLASTRGSAWGQAREDFEASWRELQERSRGIRADGTHEAVPAP